MIVHGRKYKMLIVVPPLARAAMLAVLACSSGTQDRNVAEGSDGT